MLWNGVIRMPRLSSVEVQVLVELVVAGRGGLAARTRRRRTNRYSARAPSWVIDHGTRCSSMTFRTPSVNRVARSIMCSKAASVSTSPRVARIAARDSALPASVPPDSADVDEVGAARLRERRYRLGDRVGDAVRAERDAAGDGLADHEDVRLEPPRAVMPPGPAENVCVSSIIRSAPYLVAALAQRGQEARLRQHDADVRQRRLGEDAATSPWASARSTEARSLNSATRVVTVGSTGGPTLPGRLTAAPSGPITHERLVDAAVVAVGEHEDLRPSGDQSRQPDRPPIRVGRGQRERPERQPNRRVSSAPTHSASSVGSIVVMPPSVAMRSCTARDGGRGRVTGHRAGVAEREVDVGVAVDVGDPVAVRLGEGRAGSRRTTCSSTSWARRRRGGRRFGARCTTARGSPGSRYAPGPAAARGGPGRSLS